MDSKEENAGQCKPNIQHQRGKTKRQKRKRRKGGTEAVKFTCLEMDEYDPAIEEIPENEVNVATRQINLVNALGVSDRGGRTGPQNDLVLPIPDLTDGGSRRYSWLRRYADCLVIFRPKENLAKTKAKDLGFAFWNHQGLASGASTILPIWANVSFKPVRTRLITGITELLTGANIVKKLDIAVCFGSGRFHVGQGVGNDDFQ